MLRLKNIPRLLHTLKYLKAKQLFFQVWYRIKNRFLSIGWYHGFSEKNVLSLHCHVQNLLLTGEGEYKPDNQFCFIGISHRFNDEIDWNCNVHGKLWNYNLQYFNYLLDEEIPVPVRQTLLADFSKALLNRKVKPEPYPVSLRIIHSLLFYSRHGVNDVQVLHALKAQICYLSNNLEHHLLANHLLENCFALFMAAHALNDPQLYHKAEKLLLTQLNEQILADGAHYERSPMYHSILLARLLLCIEVAEKHSLAEKNTVHSLKEMASRMLGWINIYSFPDGSWALMNDAALSIAPTTRQLQNAARHLNINATQVALKESGFRKLKGRDWELLVNAGNITPSYQPGHAHADMLSFCLWHKGRQVVIDPGTSTYAISQQRSLERGTAVHNTAFINDQNQSDTWGGFRIGKRAKCVITTETENMLEAEICNYAGQPVKHKRLFRTGNDFIEIHDCVEKDKESAGFTASVLLAPCIAVTEQQEIMLDQNIKISADRLLTIRDTQAAKHFNRYFTTKKVTYTTEGKGSLRFNFL